MKKSKDNEKITIKHKDAKINIKLIYRKRKNITIQINPNCQVSIISPFNVSKKVLIDFIMENVEWIIEKLEEYKKFEHVYKDKEYINGEKFMYLGTEYSLKIIKDTDEDIYIERNDLIIKTKNLEKEYIKDKLKIWYKKESEKLVLQRLVYCRENFKHMKALIPNKLKVKEQKKRWGTCTSKKAIYINSKISMAKLEAIDYILVHEFSHLVYMNHSKDFYNLVEEIMPNYKDAEIWLKENSYKLKL